jgi:hypothetical protein
MKTMIVAAALACSMTAAGCASIANRNDATILSMSDDNVSLRYKEGYLANAQQTADGICQERGRVARLDRVTPAGSNERVGSFTCS